MVALGDDVTANLVCLEVFVDAAGRGSNIQTS